MRSGATVARVSRGAATTYWSKAPSRRTAPVGSVCSIAAASSGSAQPNSVSTAPVIHFPACGALGCPNHFASSSRVAGPLRVRKRRASSRVASSGGSGANGSGAGEGGSSAENRPPREGSGLRRAPEPRLGRGEVGVVGEDQLAAEGQRLEQVAVAAAEAGMDALGEFGARERAVAQRRRDAGEDRRVVVDFEVAQPRRLLVARLQRRLRT